MAPRRIALLGSTGSIGRSTLEVIEAHPGRFEITALAAHSNTDLLYRQYQKYRPTILCVVDDRRAGDLAQRLSGEPVRVLAGEDELIQLAALNSVDVVVNAIVGAAGLRSSLEAVKHDKCLALANKESLVAGGPLFARMMRHSEARILPIDSEHSAVWQALGCGRAGEIRNIILTASGGPFLDHPVKQFASITPEKALRHPTWKMGPKITIDSATLANKGLEVIEAVALFSVPVDKVKVVIHRQSIVHSMVEFIDSSIIAQLSRPDMRLPITYALFWPERVESAFGRLDVAKVGSLSFEEPDLERFPVLRVAYQAAQAGGTAPAIFSAANEVAVGAFLEGSLKFTGIVDTIESALADLEIVAEPELDDIVEADSWARKAARERIGKKPCS
jgi:1-deoxy-D-xylulose-5-phosphate reductoisomerase